ncbi:hypothetical protein F9278_01405 [Streptomyces phaeolivaceus]|uniref:Uncharacterized protein n=1 Tax=Streptomyces phaeolivaceus TaxID=2653200 RepID=A0A5P8JWA9_9ACTN|nr:hypothetical protein [Streptomyces phaeolivaceus]QFQ95066.1 hypothetical protein F9278_01405 [Streptomyces phaeolivaceus]
MDASEEAARGLTDIEAFLYREGHLHAAQQRVAAFIAREPGLTPEQKNDIERWYLDEQTYVARMVTDHITDSVTAAHARHRVRLGRWLRGTMIAMTLITVATVGLCVVIVESVN